MQQLVQEWQYFLIL